MLTVLGFAAEVGHIILTCVAVGGFSFLLNMPTIVAVILLLIAVILVAIKKPDVDNDNVDAE